MKKLLTLLFTAVITFSLVMPVFAGTARPQETTKTEKTKKAAKATKAKKEKTQKETKITSTAPQQ